MSGKTTNSIKTVNIMNKHVKNTNYVYKSANN